MSASEIAARESAAPAVPGAVEAEADIVVVGGGGGGLPAALFSRWLGNDVILLEKAPELGGTAAKAAFWYWVPNNAAMRALGKEDREEDFLRYVARVSRPAGYDPDSSTFGLSDWEHAACRAIYESASPAAELLHEKGALPYRHVDAAPDYWSELPEDAAPTGRVLVHTEARESMSDGGRNSIRTMAAKAREDGVDIRLSHRVQRVVMDGGAVTGVEAATPDAAAHRIGARKAVIFASGGFTHDADLRRNFLGVPAFGGCAALTNEGDFVRISGRVGAQLRNMAHAWLCPIPLERAVARRPDMSGMFSVAGDSMIFVDKHGRRVVNEKLQYNELAQAFFVWDADAAEYPNLVLFQIWDQRSQDGSASDEYGRLIAPPGRRPRRPRGHAGRPRHGPARASGALRERHRRPRAHGRLHGEPARDDRALQRLRARRRGRGLRPRRAAGPAAVQRRRGRAAGRDEPDDVADRGARPLLRGARHRRHARHEGRPEDRHRGPRARRPRRADPRPVRGRQLRRLRVGRVVLGGRRDARPDHRVRLPRRAGERPRDGAGARGRGRVTAVGRVVGPVAARPRGITLRAA
jgi:hypothetical protein